MYHTNRNWYKKHRFSSEIKQPIIALHQPQQLGMSNLLKEIIEV